MNVFSPIHLEELSRVLKPGGDFIKVIPAGNHMKEVAELVYEKFTPHTSSIKEDIEAHSELEIVRTQFLTRTAILSKPDLVNLISMTPYLYKFSPESLGSLEEMPITIAFELVLAKRT